MYDELQDSYPTYREWKLRTLVYPYWYDEDWNSKGCSLYHHRHVKSGWSECNDKVGDFRCWKRYRKTQYKWKTN